MDSLSLDQFIEREVVLLKETFANIKVFSKRYKGFHHVTIDNEISIIDITFSPEWPLLPPMLTITRDGCVSKRDIPNWNKSMDLRMIYLEISNNPKNSIDEQIDLLKEIFPGISANFNQILKIIKINYGDYEITVPICKDSNIIINEDGKNWPENMIKQNNIFSQKTSLNLPELLSEIIEFRSRFQNCDPEIYIEKVHRSLRARFSNVTYNPSHLTFIVDHPKGLLIIGIDPETQHLPPSIAVFHQGTLISADVPCVQMNWTDWNPLNYSSDLGEILFNAQKLILD